MDIKEAYKFCPRCGSKFSKTPQFLKCAACGLSYYYSPKPVQSLILKNDKDEYLFVVRAIEPRKDYLDFPGGFVEEDENFKDSTRRELKEELGIEVGKLDYLGSYPDEYIYQGINYKVIGVAYTGRLPKDAVLKPADDVAGVEFYKLKDIPMKRLAWPSMHEMIDELIKQKR